MTQKTYYTILSIEENASVQEIEAAYKNKAHECNPSFECSELQIEVMMNISNAYKVLSDPFERYLYNRELSRINKLNKAQEKGYQKVYVEK